MQYEYIDRIRIASLKKGVLAGLHTFSTTKNNREKPKTSHLKFIVQTSQFPKSSYPQDMFIFSETEIP